MSNEDYDEEIVDNIGDKSGDEKKLKKDFSLSLEINVISLIVIFHLSIKGKG